MAPAPLVATVLPEKIVAATVAFALGSSSASPPAPRPASLPANVLFRTARLQLPVQMIAPPLPSAWLPLNVVLRIVV